MARDTENRIPLTHEQSMLYQKQQRRLAPAPYKKPTNAYFLGTTLDSNNPAVVRRNARERNRVKQVNNGFSNLRQHIPAAIVADLSNGRRGIGPGAHKKLSKVDTLRMAVEYIRRLQRVIDDSDSSDTSSVISYNSCSSSISCSPTPMGNQTEQMQNLGMNYFQAQSPSYYALSYSSGSFQPQMQNSISPADSYNSSNNSHYNFPANQCQMNSTPAMNIDEFTNTSADDDELLDYISLWQDEL